MKTIYLDSSYMCHVSGTETMQAVETEIFDGVSDVAIECYRFVPEGQEWMKPDGAVIHGQFIQPAVPVAIPDAAQSQYERDEAAHLEELGALIEEIYNEDMEVIG